MRLLALLLVALPLAGCTSPPAQGDEVVLEGNAFRPAVLEVAPGTVVSFRNADDVRHTVGFDGGASLNVPAGATAQRSFPDAGEFPYSCDVHPSMQGTIVVSR